MLCFPIGECFWCYLECLSEAFAVKVGICMDLWYCNAINSTLIGLDKCPYPCAPCLSPLDWDFLDWNLFAVPSQALATPLATRSDQITSLKGNRKGPAVVLVRAGTGTIQCFSILTSHMLLAHHLPTTWCKLKGGIKHIQRESDKSSEASRLASLGATNRTSLWIQAGWPQQNLCKGWDASDIRVIRSQSSHSMKCFFSVWCWCKTARNLKRVWTLHEWQGQKIETSYDFKTLTCWK